MAAADQLVAGALASLFAPKPQKVSMAVYRAPGGLVRFVREVLRADPTPYQERILNALQTYHRVAVRGPHGLGKTALSSWVILWSQLAFDNTDVKTVTTAGIWRQLVHFTWPEVHKWARAIDYERLPFEFRLGKELLTQSISIGQRQAFAAASDKPDTLEGAHANVLFYVFDEAKIIPDGVWNSVEGAFSGAGADTGNEAYALAISTPGERSGRFYDIHSRRPGTEDWHAIHVTLADAIAAKRISQQWVERRKVQWGEESAVYQNRVLGEFADADERSIIPLRWVEMSNERWEKLEGRGDGDLALGLDPAFGGEDKTAIARVRGAVCERIDTASKQGPMQTVGTVTAQLGQDTDTPIGVDVIGIGAGVYDRLRELGYRAIPVNAGARAIRRGQREFVNLRAYLWFLLRDALDPDGDWNIAIPRDDLLTGDLVGPFYEYNSQGKIVVESKDDLRARIGRSPDRADALALALYAQVFGGSMAEVNSGRQPQETESRESEQRVPEMAPREWWE